MYHIWSRELCLSLGICSTLPHLGPRLFRHMWDTSARSWLSSVQASLADRKQAQVECLYYSTATQYNLVMRASTISGVSKTSFFPLISTVTLPAVAASSSHLLNAIPCSRLLSALKILCGTSNAVAHHTVVVRRPAKPRAHYGSGARIYNSVARRRMTPYRMTR